MSLPGSPASTLETTVGRDKKPPHNRARDEGTVKPLGVEITAPLYALLEKCRKAKKWSKRSAVEEALRDWLIKEGYTPPPEPTEEAE